MDKMIGYCGINCEKCEARIATIKDDDKMREEVSRKWCELFHTDIITPDRINCTGCRGDGVKYFFCNELCEIKPCVTNKLLCLQTESYHRALSKHSERFRSADGDEPLRYASRTLVILRTMKGLRLARAGR